MEETIIIIAILQKLMYTYKQDIHVTGCALSHSFQILNWNKIIYSLALVIVSTTSVEVATGSMLPVSLYPITSGSTIDMDWPNITASASIPPTPAWWRLERQRGSNDYGKSKKVTFGMGLWYNDSSDELNLMLYDTILMYIMTAWKGKLLQTWLVNNYIHHHHPSHESLLIGCTYHITTDPIQLFPSH